jgi:hypothetical protein
MYDTLQHAIERCMRKAITTVSILGTVYTKGILKFGNTKDAMNV